MELSRREQDRGRRRDLIVEHARQLAESEGWEAVTVRRLAERIQYSQPVLYSHFGGRDEIVREVAVEGFVSIAGELRAAREQAGAGGELEAVLSAYLAFEAAHPAVYEAMFGLTVDLPFATPDVPPALLEAFGEIEAVVGPIAAGRDVAALAELVWASLHGLATLTHSGRLLPAAAPLRLSLLQTLLTTPHTEEV